ncbi:uncharacterized protein B0I36DRAFT_365395 [Microdochium trichocladiopsis]|uniref:Zn(2)-C6 fungal-type domain-containing protein n=1 Tax=Microdochium trichocladiopsis TaxID=1682393 RepID=A0A9P9BQC2_9PEZI|nr:uncharacterized protein B0I36DRAFT_365395 [Microdochium trichocladiopsis]KAH7025722.1 hypothetical protein B0I36DRAFT_365395 [Microdochium trichocladiopsis]
MSEREAESENTAPRKRIAVACSRCRKRKIRCSGDPGNGGACTNCKNASYEPCMFLRVHSTETQMKENGYYNYNPDTARAFQSRTISPAGSVSGYGADTTTADLMGSYRPSSFSYGSRGSYYSPSVSSWGGASAYPDDSAEYATYSSYPMLGQDSVPLVPGYSRYGTAKPVYVDTEVPAYNYGSLVSRPSPQDTSPFTLSSMSASLPSTTERLIASGRGLLQAAGAVDSSSRMVAGYPSKPGPDATSSTAITDTYTGGEFDSPVSYAAVPTTLPPSETSQQRSMLQSDAVDPIYAVDSYSYGTSTQDQSRRGSLSGCGATMYPADPHQTAAMAAPYGLPSSSTTSSAATSTHGSCGDSAAGLDGRSTTGHNSTSSSASSTTSNHSQPHSIYDTRALGSLRGAA